MVVKLCTPAGRVVFDVGAKAPSDPSDVRVQLMPSLAPASQLPGGALEVDAPLLLVEPRLAELLRLPVEELPPVSPVGLLQAARERARRARTGFRKPSVFTGWPPIRSCDEDYIPRVLAREQGLARQAGLVGTRWLRSDWVAASFASGMACYLLLLAALAASPSSVAAKAEALTRRAIVEYNGREFDQALADAKEAYALRPAIGLLFNLGQIHRALHHWEEAAFSYKAYLRERPDAVNRSIVLSLIKEMEQRMAAVPAPEQRSEADAETPAPTPPAPSPAAPPQPLPGAPSKPRRTKVAFSELEAGLRADPKLSHLITTLLTSEIRKRPALSVTTQDDIKALLGFERQKALMGCNDAVCLAEIGGALGVDQMVTGSLSRAGESLVLALRVVDVHTGLVLRDVTRRVQGGSEDALIDALPGLVADLYPEALPELSRGALSASTEVQATHGRSSAPWWLVGAGAAVAAVGGGLVAYELASKQSTTSNGVTTYVDSWPEAQSANNVGYAGQTAIGVGAAVLVAGVVWALVRPAEPEATP